MSRDEFVAKWKRVIAGGFLYGYTDERRLGPAAQAEKAMNVGPEVERLLGQMYDSLKPGSGEKK